MKIFEKLEEHAHLLLQELRQHMLNQMGVGNKINEDLHDFVTHLESHVNPTPVDSAPAPVAPVVDVTPAPAPVVPVAVVEETVVVEAPQTVAQEQSASNVAN
jgi:hypothetical protein